MLIQTIALAIFLSSLTGVSLILARKVTVLNSLPQNGTTGIRKHRIILDIENKFKEILLSFEKQIYFHKFLSFIKVLTLKIETRVDIMLHRIRKKAQQIDKKNIEKK